MKRLITFLPLEGASIGSISLIVESPMADSEEEVVPIRRKCATCCKNFLAFLFSTVGLCCLLVGYTVLGGFVFVELEQPHEIKMKLENINNNSVTNLTNSTTDNFKIYEYSNFVKERAKTVELLWKMTREYNVLFEEKWKKNANRLLEKFESSWWDGYRRFQQEQLKTTPKPTKELGSKRKALAKDNEDDLVWTFAGALLFSVTVITTIGNALQFIIIFRNRNTVNRWILNRLI